MTDRRGALSPPPEISYEGTPETEERALAAVWEIVLREKEKREDGAAQAAADKGRG